MNYDQNKIITRIMDLEDRGELSNSESYKDIEILRFGLHDVTSKDQTYDDSLAIFHAMERPSDSGTFDAYMKDKGFELVYTEEETKTNIDGIPSIPHITITAKKKED